MQVFVSGTFRGPQTVNVGVPSTLFRFGVPSLGGSNSYSVSFPFRTVTVLGCSNSCAEGGVSFVISSGATGAT